MLYEKPELALVDDVSAIVLGELGPGEDSAGEPFLQIPAETLVGLDD